MMTNELINMPTTGGPVLENNLFYIERNVDGDLYERLKLNELCYILQSRQTGKTSLLFRICKRLSEDGIKSMRIALTEIDIQDAEKRTWYNDQMDIIKKELKLELDLKQFREDNKSLSPLRTFDKFIQDILLGNVEQPIVIFIDEIDSVLSLPFPTDDYFAFIRNCYEKRANNPKYRHLTFCLVGAASPNDLIADKKRTPFNIGTSITLSPFPTDIDNNNESCKVMKPFLDYVQDMGVLKKILDWTGGHPFLTQKLCNLWVDQNKESKSIIIKNVDEIVESMIKNWEADDNPTHFGTIRDRLLDNDVKAFDRLKLYEEILENRQIDYNNSREQIELRLSGLVLEDEGQLRLYNPIYKEIFNLNWVEQEKAKLRLYIEEFDNWNEWKRWKQTNNLAYDLQERYLLYGTKCDQVQQWRINFNGDLSEREGRFLDVSQTFWGEVKDLFSGLPINEGTMESIIQSANDLTGGLHKFNRIVFNIAKNNNVVDLQQDEVQGWLENLVLSHLNRFKDDELFIKDQGQFSNQDDASIDSFALISTFEKIYQKEPIRFDEKNPQHRKLKDMCFIILDKEHNLRILNKIYEKILDQNWIKEVMAGLRPYKKAFRGWQDSDRQESSYLLQNNDLKLALEWLGKKPTPKLEEGEIEFVMTSLVAEVWTTASPSVQSEAVSLITTFRPSLQGKNNYSDFLLREILQWTRHEPLLLRELLEVVNKTEIFTTNYHNWIEQLVKTQIINNWQDSKLAEHFRLIEQRLTNHQSSESFWLIVKYRQILLQGKIEFDEIREDTKLIELGLVVKLDQQLEIANPIYENIFSQRWTYQKLSECKRIRAINLLKWCRANIPEQNDPVLRSYLDEWINNNATIIEKIVQEAKGEVLDNKFDFIDEIKLLTYDIVKMDSVETSQIQLCLDRTFDKETKKMKQDNLDKLLSTIVEEGTAIEAVAIVNLEEGGLEYYNKELETSKPEIYRALFGQRDASEALADFADLKGIPTALKTFGAATKYGALEYSLFYLDKGIVIVDFLDLPEVTVAICFIATTEANPTKIVRQYRDRIDELKSQLEKTLG